MKCSKCSYPIFFTNTDCLNCKKIASKDKINSSGGANLATETIEILKNPTKETVNNMLQILAVKGETGGVIALWDKLKEHDWKVSDCAWNAMNNLHNRGKGKIPNGTFNLSTGRRLAPPRRLHKIFKGKRLSKRSDEAKKHIDHVIKLIENGQLEFDPTANRFKFAKDISKIIGVPLEVARGIVTKLKQRKRFSTKD